MKLTNLTHAIILASSLFVAMPSFADNNPEKASLPVLRITISDPIVRGMKYSKGTMQLTDTDGKVIEMKAKFKTRGATAQQYMMKPSLNMKLRTEDYASSQDSLLLGIRSASKWILDAMAIDPICMRNRVCMDIWNEYSKLPYETNFDDRSGTVGKFIELYINNEYYGIYCLSDHINRKLLNLKKYDETNQKVRGVLYKSGTEDILQQNERSFLDDYTAAVVDYHNAWELKEPEDFECREAWEPLLDLYDNRKQFTDVKTYFFMDNLVDYQLHVMALSIQDNWGNKNHFFSIRNIQKDINDADATESARRKCIVSPWDLDTSLGGDYKGSYYDGKYAVWDVKDISSYGGFYPFNICNEKAEYKAALKARWQELRSTTYSTASINARLEAYRDLFINSGAWERMTSHFDKKKYKPCYVSDLAKEISYIEKWYAERHDQIDQYFGIDASGIESVSTEKQETEGIVYSLQGVRLAKAPTKGVYIQDGKVRIK